MTIVHNARNHCDTGMVWLIKCAIYLEFHLGWLSWFQHLDGILHADRVELKHHTMSSGTWDLLKSSGGRELGLQ